MARIRSIKPEFWDSPGTAKASLRARLLFIAMWNWADDWGVGDANPKRLLGFAFPSDGDSAVEPRNFRHLAAEVADCFDVCWYEVAGREYYSIPSWEEHQRTEKRAKQLNPGPDQAERYLYEAVSENPPLNRGSSGVGTGEQGNRGTGEKHFRTCGARERVRHRLGALAEEGRTEGSSRTVRQSLEEDPHPSTRPGDHPVRGRLRGYHRTPVHPSARRLA